MKSTIEANTSITHGSCRLPVIWHRVSYISSGERPLRSSGALMPRIWRSLAVALPTFGRSVRCVKRSRFTLAGFIVMFSHGFGSLHDPSIDTTYFGIDTARK